MHTDVPEMTPMGGRVAKLVARLVASAGGVGFAPKAPGTMGTLAAMPFGWGLLHWPPGLWLAILLVCPLGVLATRYASGGEDHGWIVIDEVAGLWITLLGLLALPRLPAPTGLALLAWMAVAFALFRLLDITKPGLIGRIDRRHDSIGVMGDDVLAGMVGAVLLLGLRSVVVWMG